MTTTLAPAPSDTESTPTTRPGLAIAVLAFAGMGGAFMQTILIPIQGRLPALLDASPQDTAWVITVTLLVSAIFTPISGKLGDMYGKRRVALILMVVLISGSVVAALSFSVVPLIIGRALQGAGVGVIPLGISILRDILPKRRLGSAIALVSATLGVGGALGLPISAFVTQNFDWHALFWVASGIGVVSFFLILWIIPASTLRAGGRFDYLGAVGLAIGLVGVLLGVSRGNEWGWTSLATLSLLGGGIAVLLLWGWFEVRTGSPLVDLRVAARGPVLFTNLASIAMGFALFASSIVFPQLLQLPKSVGGMGLPLLEAAFVLMPSGLAMLAVSPIAGRLQRTVGAKPLLVAGATIIALTYLACVFLDLAVWHVLVVNTVIGVGIGLGYAAMPSLIMQSVPVHETAAANGFNTLMRALGTTVAAAVIAGILTQSSVEVGGIAAPSGDGFQMAFVLGLAAAVVCAVFALLIPRPAAHPGEEESLPAGAV